LVILVHHLEQIEVHARNMNAGQRRRRGIW